MKNLAANKIIVILGPNGSGKSELAVKIAEKWGGEIISADSRQVYCGLDIGSGKVEGIWKKISNFKFPVFVKTSADRQFSNKSQILNSKLNLPKLKKSKFKIQKKYFAYKNIIHHCIDFVSPKKVFSAAEFKKCAEKAIKDIWNRRKIPIICGGTGFYIDVALGNLKIPEIPPNFKLREKLEKKSCTELFKMLQKLNQERAKSIDKNNKRRLIRAVEIENSKLDINHRGLTSVVVIEKFGSKKYGDDNKIINGGHTFKLGGRTSKFDILYIGIKHQQEILKQRIEKRLKDRLRKGMIKEVKDLHFKYKLSWKRLNDLGLEYRYTSYFLLGKKSEKELFEKIKTEDWRYAKRQMTWFKKNKKINWIKNEKEAKKLVKKFIS